MSKLPKFAPATEEAILEADGRLLSKWPVLTWAALFEKLKDRETLVGLFDSSHMGGDKQAPALDELQFQEWNLAVMNGIQRLIGYYAIETNKIAGHYNTGDGEYEPWKELDENE
ncbi:MAG: hypothetical protein O3A81_02785 [bacterium]|nr:hypothetical protein [bacterium]